MFLTFALAATSARADFVPVDLGTFFNNDGIATRENPADGAFDSIGAYGEATFNYPAEELPPSNSIVTVGPVPFRFGDKGPGAKNNVWTQGQTVPVPSGRYAALYMLGSSVNGGFQSPMVFEYKDGKELRETLGLSDWCQPAQYGETVAYRTSYRYFIPGRSEEPTPTALFVQTLQVDSSRVLGSIRLPQNNSFHVFGMTLSTQPPQPLPSAMHLSSKSTAAEATRIESPDVVAVGGSAEFVLHTPEALRRHGLRYRFQLEDEQGRALQEGSGDVNSPDIHFAVEPSAKVPGVVRATVALRSATAGPGPGENPIAERDLRVRPSSLAVLPDVREDLPSSPFYGMNAPLTMSGDREATALLRLLKIAGVRSIRVGFDWGAVEPRPGEWDFSRADRLVDIPRRQGIEIYGLLGYWSGWSAAYTEEGYRQYARFAGRLAERYKSRIRYWEVWNEPNIFYWKKGPREYAQLLKQVHEAVKRADPDSIVCSPAAAGVPLDWIEELFKLGAMNTLDAVSIHPYRMNGAYPEESDFAGELDRLRALVNRYGGADKPIILSEVGYWTHRSGEGAGVTEREQAAGLVRTFLWAAAIPRVERVLWYRFDDPGYESWNEHHFGVVEPALNPKPAYVALATLTRLLPKPVFRRWVTNGPEVYAAEFRAAADAGASLPDGVSSVSGFAPPNAESVVTVLWAKRGERRVELRLPPGTRQVSMLGEASAAAGETRTITDEPIYFLSAQPLDVRVVP